MATHFITNKKVIRNTNKCNDENIRNYYFSQCDTWNVETRGKCGIMAYDVLKFKQCAHFDIKTQPAKQQILCLKTAND